METRDEHARILGTLAGEGGDYYIGTTAVSNKRFTHIIIGPDGAVIDDIKIRGVSVKTARNYGTLKAGYILCAGSGEYFDYIKLTSGDAQGLVRTENAYVLLNAVAVADGITSAALTATLTFTNDETKYGEDTQEVTYQILDSDDAVVAEGTANVFFLNGSGDLTVDMTGLTYPVTAGTGYTIKVKLSGQANTNYVEDTFDVTA